MDTTRSLDLEHLSKIYSTQGYLVLGFNSPCEIGFTWSSILIGDEHSHRSIAHPMRISAPSTRQEYIDQFRILYPGFPFMTRAYKFFYRCESD